MSRHPNFIYIGTSKAGSTWLFDVLSRHPDVYMTPGKGLDFLAELKVRFQPGVDRLDQLLGTQLSQQWGYTYRSADIPFEEHHLNQ